VYFSSNTCWPFSGNEAQAACFLPCSPSPGQVDTKGEPGLDLDPTASSQEDFLSREKAALGDDANQFASASDKFKPTAVEDGDDDLLGGGSAPSTTHLGGDDMSQFTSSFPSIDTRNEVRILISRRTRQRLTKWVGTACCTRRIHYRHK
jgi:hypothetical protein